jgi:hypothetical protein
MAVFDRFRRREGILEHRFARMLDAAHPRVTAHGALDIAAPIAATFDQRAYPTLMSTASVDETGRSETWECGFDSRDRLARLWVNLSPRGIELQAVPLINHAADSVMPALWKRLDAAGRQIYLDGWFEHTALAGFVDSERALELLLEADEGIDLLTGSTNVSLATNRTDETWVLSVSRRTWRTALFV